MLGRGFGMMAEEASKEGVRKDDEDAAAYGPAPISELASTNKGKEDARLKKMVITEMEEFASGVQLNRETRKRDVFNDEVDDATSTSTLVKDDTSGLALLREEAGIVDQAKDRAFKPDEVLHESAVGKGLGGALKFLKDRGTLNEGAEKTSDKKKSKPVGFKDGPKQIHIHRTDEFGREMTMKEAFRALSHKFHGKGPGKTKQEKRQKKFQDELKAKRMKSSDTPLMSAERMREAQARSKTPYLVLSGGAKPSPRG